MDSSKPIRLRFGPFEADLRSSELFESGVPVHLQSKPFQFLAALLQHPGEVVSREQMSHVLWPDIYVQVNQGLNAAARKVRIALRDTVETPVYFETLGSDGYRFIHDLEILSWSSSDSEQTEAPLSLAVLPFQTPDAESFSGKGFAAELAGLLGRLYPTMRVIAPASSIRCSNEDIRISASQLGASYIVQGLVERRRNRVGFTVFLRDAETGETLGHCIGEKSTSEVSACLREIADAIGKAIPGKTFPIGLTSPAMAKTEFPVYMEYCRAQETSSYCDLLTAGSTLRAFTEVAKRDPGFAPAHAGAALAGILLAQYELLPPRPSYQAALRAGLTAIQLDPELPEAMVATAWSRLALEHDWARAARLYERALQNNPSYAFGYVGYGTLLLARGRVEDAVSAMRRACTLDPLSPFTSTSLATAYYYSRQYDEAILQAKYSLELSDHWSPAYAIIGASALAQRRFTDALQHFEDAVALVPQDPVLEAHLAHAYAQVGKLSNAEPILDRMENRNGGLPKPAFHIALVRLVLGDINGAVRWLDQACRERFERTLFLPIDPRLDVLRGTKNFEEMCKRVREPDPRQMQRDEANSRGGAA